MQQLILNILQFFHKPFAKKLPFQTFKYVACGGGNTLLDIVLYYISWHYILLEQEVIYAGPFAIQGAIVAFLMAFAVTFPTGFLLSKYITFTESNLRGRVQLIRYFLLVAVCIGMNWAFLTIFVKYCGFYPTVSKILTTIFVVSFSYITQKRFTFKEQPVPMSEVQAVDAEAELAEDQSARL
ncbi:GtrA family protein [Chitinophaga horti]|uniref:GtrA family protein n=1 Tax=Chitinophaga horti TaxID=2920382 RepID=A0ABY6J5N2_9BACT|nr:GtrA family protein [Chitinophaga horti]UYQ93599.1 GtrA family protein [Chitinophaga horti]